MKNEVNCTECELTGAYPCSNKTESGCVLCGRYGGGMNYVVVVKDGHGCEILMRSRYLLSSLWELKVRAQAMRHKCVEVCAWSEADKRYCRLDDAPSVVQLSPMVPDKRKLRWQEQG